MEKISQHYFIQSGNEVLVNAKTWGKEKVIMTKRNENKLSLFADTVVVTIYAENPKLSIIKTKQSLPVCSM